MRRFAVTRAVRPFLPPKFRYLAPYDVWRRRQRGELVPDEIGARGARSGSGSGADTPRASVEGLLLDIDGVLVTSWDPIPGAIEAMDALRAAGCRSA